MEENKREITAYVHNLSPLKTSGKKNTYFDMQLQTEKNVVCAVCFSSRKHREFEDIALQKSPVKLTNIEFDKHDKTSVLMGGKVQLHKVSVPFPIKPLPSTVNIASLSAINENQIVTFKAKVVQLSATKRFPTKDGIKEKAEALLVDPHGGIKIVICEKLIAQVGKGGTYTFSNMKVRKDNYTGNTIYISTPNATNCTITECEEFTQPLANTAELSDTFTSKTVSAEVIGIHKFCMYYTCIKCKAKLTTIKLKINIKIDNYISSYS